MFRQNKNRNLFLKGPIGYSCNLDIAEPTRLREYGVLAERAGFNSIWASDHFHPWFHTGAFESFTWVWMTALFERTSKAPIGTGATAPILRYHPALIAQAFATMQKLYGNRVFITLGSGEAINEMPFGYSWPRITERRERVVEAAKIMRKLWTEDFVTFKGKYFTLKDANLYMKAEIPIFFAASGPRMAEATGEFADGFLTIKGAEYAKSELFPALDRGARKSGRKIEDIPKVIEIDLSYSDDYEKALVPLRTQAGPLLPEMFIDPIHDPRDVEAAGKMKITDKDLANAYVIGSSSEDFIKPIEQSLNAGFDYVYLASLSPDEHAFIELARKEILPYFTEKYSTK